MAYSEKIKELLRGVPAELADFSLPRDADRVPTQASSNFITNKEQGDWAENLVLNAINDSFEGYVAVKYGKSDDLVAGEVGFDEFFREFQEELDQIGKRPDLLVFRESDYDEDLGRDISRMGHDRIAAYVKKAVAGIEVRSSAILIDRYDKAMHDRVSYYTKEALRVKSEILEDFMEELSHWSRSSYLEILNGITENTLCAVDFKIPGWRANGRLSQLNDRLRELKSAIKEVQKRDFLSITPKVEDLKVVYKWVETYNVPHYYFQVFFDKIYGISFEQILQIISNPDNEGLLFSVESDAKNQNKTTIKIKSKAGVEIASKVDEPRHQSVRKELDRGRLLYYVSFKGGAAYLNVKSLMSVLKEAF